MMFSTIVKHECITWFRKPGFYFLIVLFYLLPLFLFIGTGGYFDGGNYGENNVQLFINSPFQIHSFLQYIGKFLLFLLPAIIGTTLYRDFQHGTYQILYSYPIPKSVYLAAKFTSAFTLVILISQMPILAFITGEIVLGTENPNITQPGLAGYLYTYGVILLPNLFVFGILVFCIVALFRNIYAGFLLVLLLIVFQVMIENLFHASPGLINLLDPFGQSATMDQTRLWTLAEKNTQHLTITGQVLLNRVFWMVIAMGAGVFTLKAFRLHYFGWEITAFRNFWGKKQPIKRESPNVPLTDLKVSVGFKQNLVQLFTMVRNQVSFMLRHWIFYVFTLAGILLLVFMLNRVLLTNDVVMLPLTRLILQVPALFFSLIVVFATFIFSGMIVLREKESAMEPLLYSTGTPTAIIVASKAVSLIVIQLLLLFLLMATGVTMQAVNGYFRFDFPQYLFSLFLIQAPPLAVWALLSVFIFSITRHLYIGLLILLLAWLAQFGYEQIGITTSLLQFNTYAALSYSDLNGFGHALSGRLLLQAYWLFWGVLLLFMSILYWPRIQTSSFREKSRLILRSVNLKHWALIICIAIPLTYVAYVIKTAENSAITFTESQRELDEFESAFSELKQLAQPRITSLSIDMDLYPDKQEFRASGEYWLANRSNQPIDTILVKTSIDEITQYRLGMENQKVDSFPAFNFSVHQLNKPLQPGDSLRLTFSISNRPNTLFQRNSGVLANGTYLNQQILPRIGYFLNMNKPEPDDESALGNHYQAVDSDLVRYKATISTSGDQIAFSNGGLVDQRQQDGRKIYTYQPAEPVKFNFHFNSGNYRLYEDEWRDISIAIYHHPDHTDNLQTIAYGVKASLEFNHSIFGQTPLDDIRIIEYPLSLGSFSTLTSNTILMSESVFGVNTDFGDKIDFPFYIAAHEMTHHWIGNQLLPKDASGALFISESITEYLTLQLFKNTYGEAKAREFLKIQHQRYFTGRTIARKVELPLYRVEDGQEYISYGKGAVALNSISHALGREIFHGVLSDFFLKFHGSERYPTSIDFFDMLQQATPDSLQHLTEELFMRSVLYDIEIADSSLRTSVDGDWIVNVNYLIRAFEQGDPAEVPFQKIMELGVYDENGELLKLLEIDAKGVHAEKTLSLKFKPHRLVLDPNYLILDQDRSNNEFIFD